MTIGTNRVPGRRTFGAASRYHSPVQTIELGLLVAAALAILVVATMRVRATFSERPAMLGAMLGIVPGIIGAVVVLVPRTDLIPDAAEPVLWITVGLVTSGFALIAFSLGLARH